MRSWHKALGCFAQTVAFIFIVIAALAFILSSFGHKGAKPASKSIPGLWQIRSDRSVEELQRRMRKLRDGEPIDSDTSVRSSYEEFALQQEPIDILRARVAGKIKDALMVESSSIWRSKLYEDAEECGIVAESLLLPLDRHDQRRFDSLLDDIRNTKVVDARHAAYELRELPDSNAKALVLAELCALSAKRTDGSFKAAAQILSGIPSSPAVQRLLQLLNQGQLSGENRITLVRTIGESHTQAGIDGLREFCEQATKLNGVTVTAFLFLTKAADQPEIASLIVNRLSAADSGPLAELPENLARIPGGPATLAEVIRRGKNDAIRQASIHALRFSGFKDAGVTALFNIAEDVRVPMSMRVTAIEHIKVVAMLGSSEREQQLTKLASGTDEAAEAARKLLIQWTGPPKEPGYLPAE